MTLRLGGIDIPHEGAGAGSQSYDFLRASIVRRTGNGTAILRTRWSGKLRTTIAGDGWAPSGLNGLDFDSALTLRCIEPLIISDPSNSITLPSARRSDGDFVPVGFAVVNGHQVDTTINVVGDTATLGTVSGATAYRAMYWPEISVYAKLTQESQGLSGRFGWSLECEEL